MGRKRSMIIASDGDLIVERDPDRASGRLLRQNEMDASYIDLADARHLEFDYLRWARIVLQSFNARRVLHLGGAGCTLARALLAAEPSSYQEVVELDQKVLDFSREHLGLRKQPGLKLRVGDGRAAVSASADDGFDAIMIDAFLGARVPRHLLTAEALSDCARVAPVAVVNVVDVAGWTDVRAVAAGLDEAYPYVAALAGGARRPGNIVMFGAGSEPRYASLGGAAAADPAAPRVLSAEALSGAGAWRDASL